MANYNLYDDKIKLRDSELAEQNKWTDANANLLRSATLDLDSRVSTLESGGVNPTVVSAIWQSGFTFDCTATSYPINNIFYSAPNTTVVLSASDATLDRIDLIVAKIPVSPATVGTIQVIEGTLATTALVVPPDYDPSEYFVIKKVIIRATATVPVDDNETVFTTENIYSDGLGEPNEWTFSSNSATVLNTGGVIDATNPNSGNKATLTNDVPIPQITNLFGGSLSFKIKLKASLGNSFIFIKWFNSTSQISKSLLFRDGDYGLDGTSLDWQTIVINASDFIFNTNDDVDALQIYPFKSFAGYELDNIQINVGGGVVTPVVNGIEEAPIDGKVYSRSDKNWVESGVGTLQEVTDLGNTTDNNILINGVNKNLILAVINNTRYTDII